MKLFLLNIGEVLPGHTALVSKSRAEKAARYRFLEDKKRCIAGGILLSRYLGGRKVYTDPLGKPRADGICFNLSHSGEWVLLSVSRNETGCDIEKHKIVNPLKLGKVVFTENELKKISSSKEKLAPFYELWTKKEALLKCMGEGFHRGAKSVDVSADIFEENGKRYYMRTKTFADYTLSACCLDSDFSIETEIVHI